jgi:hypothetical protein
MQVGGEFLLGIIFEEGRPNRTDWLYARTLPVATICALTDSGSVGQSRVTRTKSGSAAGSEIGADGPKTAPDARDSAPPVSETCGFAGSPAGFSSPAAHHSFRSRPNRSEIRAEAGDRPPWRAGAHEGPAGTGTVQLIPDFRLLAGGHRLE